MNSTPLDPIHAVAPIRTGLPIADLVFLSHDPGQTARVIASSASVERNCYTCTHRRSLLPTSANSACLNPCVTVQAHPRGIKNGWWIFPTDFDPIWLESCDGWAAIKLEASVV